MARRRLGERFVPSAADLELAEEAAHRQTRGLSKFAGTRAPRVVRDVGEMRRLTAEADICHDLDVDPDEPEPKPGWSYARGGVLPGPVTVRVSAQAGACAAWMASLTEEVAALVNAQCEAAAEQFREALAAMGSDVDGEGKGVSCERDG